MSRWLSLLFVTLALVCLTTASTIDKDPGTYPDSSSSGWSTLPSVAGAAFASIPVGNTRSEIGFYYSSGRTNANIKRAVIQVHGKERDAWNHWLYANLSSQRAVQGGDVKDSEVMVVAPIFLTTADSKALPRSVSMAWKDESWADGVESVRPSGSTVGSFDALDAIVNYALDTSTFPNLVTIVVAGFSLGAQMVQRYSILKPTNATQDAKLNYWVCSPNSYLYLNSTRPVKVSSSCSSSYNEYKYGLDGDLPSYVSNSYTSPREGTLAPHLLNRRISYAVGAKDSGSMDICAANAQGGARTSKMIMWTQNVLPYVTGGTGSLPANSSVDYIKDTTHQAWRTIQSDSGVRRLFLEDYSARGSVANAPPSNGLTSVAASETSGGVDVLTVPAVSLLASCVLAALALL